VRVLEVLVCREVDVVDIFRGLVFSQGRGLIVRSDFCLRCSGTCDS
jgi:hypothetical protein